MGGPSETISVIQQRTVAESSEQEIQAFDFISHPNASSLCEQLVGMIDGKPALLEPLTHPPAMTFGANNAFSAAFDHYVVMYSSENDNTSPEKPLDGTESVSENSIMSTSIAHGADYNTFGSFESHADNCLPVNKILRTDVLMAIKKRVLSNYEFDCAHNAALVNDHFLKDVWNWIGLCHERQKNEPLYNELPVDFAFQGVLGLWFMSTGFSHFLDVLEYKPSRATQQMYLKSASALVSKLGRDVYTAKNTNKPLRQLGMIICGVDCSIQELDSRLEQLVHSNQIIDAVGLALFHGRIESVVRVLSAGNDQERMLSTAVAGYITAQGLTHSGSDSLWKEMCRNLSTELEEPYLRAVFAYIGNSDWRDVLDELSLPLRDRLGVALRFLPDEDLSKYLEDLCRNVVTTGDPEGLLLTGLTPLGIDLLQNYVNQTSDIQTSALISSFVVPLKFTDERADCWISSYRNLLNQWQLFHKRAFFDIGRNELSKNRKGEITLRRIVQPFYVRCNYCKKSFSFSAAEKQAAVLSKGGRKFVDTSKRSACPRCHQQLPVCCVCGLSLGMSITNNDSRRKSVVYGISSSTAHCDEWLSFCLSCGHGMHAVHAKEWFSRHHVCPMATCNCRCTHS
ncbi:ubiquitin-protein ligase E3 [Schizosaccharomyces japonicus yFS275]|uniref:Ubiquitin-protein ligase E3 n=1 Tax=Schizosaccharomyces japonicus (strain yFS275 / FY16936) TaxID=402676 RepID=B6JVZ6_SCHJY|nr:ubiquitin-protein ligase E3 [Schizosaccharomyces japonicus yFS275]EEB05547.2 ubiquitin-protein ligase E3 [Schizosaccharomyces japonicus yFS275]